jgi:hypothetical protein
MKAGPRVAHNPHRELLLERMAGLSDRLVESGANRVANSAKQAADPWRPQEVGYLA